MYRKDGAIPVLTCERYPLRFMVFDTEAFRGISNNGLEVQTFRLAVTRFIQLDKGLGILEDAYNYFQSISGFTDFIDDQSRKDKTLFIYAHNIKYDLQLSGLLRYLLDKGWKVSSFVFEDPPTFVKLTHNRSHIVFVDTFNYWQTSLAKLGEQLGTAKLEMPTDQANIDDWFTYCKRDVQVLSEYILSFMRFLKSNDLCGMGLTLASQAFRSFRHKFMDHPIILHNRNEVLKLEREAYSGGRVEAFRVGEFPQQPYYKLDVNSMYPFVMKGELYPYELFGYSENIPLSKLADLIKKYYVIASVHLNTDQAAYPYKQLHKLIFPVGQYVTTLHNAEIVYALSREHIVTVDQVAIYSQSDIFSPYIDYFYHMKLEAEQAGNGVIRQQAKILMNSLYGKFGQRNVTSKIVPNVTPTKYGRITGYSETLQCRVEVNCLGDQMEVSYKQGEAPYSFPAIAGAVTAYARMYLWKLMQTAELMNVFYCDTDSLIVNEAGLSNLSSLINPFDLGLLKIEDQSSLVYVYGAKDYHFGDEIKHKGVPKSAREIADGKWEYEQFRGAKTWLNDGLNTNVEVYTRVKERKTPYDKGVIQPDNSVIPLFLREWG